MMLQKIALVMTLSLLMFSTGLSATMIHVNPQGFDNSGNDGSVGCPYKTIEYALACAKGVNLSKQVLERSVTIYLAPGKRFDERIVIDPQTSGDIPVTITSDPYYPAYLVPSATTLAKTAVQFAGAIAIKNKANTVIENLKVIGPGMDNTSERGILCEATTGQFTGLTIRGCEVYGWIDGVSMMGYGNDTYGFKNVLVENCDFHDNRNVGLATWAEGVTGFTNVTVRKCRVWNNLGDPNATKHTGSGIVLGSVTDGLIERCSAWNNGERSVTTGGPVAIWTWFSTRVTIQYCDAYNNHAVKCDGGGFDLDGGAQACTIQYCYSRDNDGAGYLVCQYAGARAFKDNVVRYNISQNDGRKNGFGAIHFWSSGSNGGIQNTKIYGNTVYSAYAPAVRFQNLSGQTGTKLWNNIFMTANGKALVDNSPSVSVALFQNNCYWSGSSAFRLGTYTSLSAWRTGMNQEKAGSSAVGLQSDPLLSSPGTGGTVGVDNLISLTGYKLKASSPCINAGANLSVQGVSSGTRDFYGNSVPCNGAFDIGVSENCGAVQEMRLAPVRGFHPFSGGTTAGLTLQGRTIHRSNGVVRGKNVIALKEPAARYTIVPLENNGGY